MIKKTFSFITLISLVLSVLIGTQFSAAAQQKLTGITFGTPPSSSNVFGNAFDGNTDTAFGGQNGGYCGIDLGEGNEAYLTAIKFFPRKNDGVTDFAGRCVGGRFQGANGPATDYASLTWETIYTFDTAPAASTWTHLEVEENFITTKKFRYLRFISATNLPTGVAELEFYTDLAYEPGEVVSDTISNFTWELGNIASADGSLVASSAIMRSKNYIVVDYSKTYRIFSTNGATDFRVYFYNAQGGFISAPLAITTASLPYDIPLTAETHYIKLRATIQTSMAVDSQLVSIIEVGANEARDVTLEYLFKNTIPGNADGEIIITANDTDSIGAYTICFADDDGVLSDFTEITTINVSAVGNPVTGSPFITVNAIPYSATRIVACYGGQIVGEYEIPKVKLTNNAEKLYSFAALSDIHLGSSVSPYSNGAAYFQKALQCAQSENVSFVTVSGDITTDHGESDLALYQSIVNTYAKNGDGTPIPVWPVSGNHDCNIVTTPLWEQYTDEKLYYEKKFGDDIYLFVGMVDYTYDSTNKNTSAVSGEQFYTTETLDWLESKLEEHKSKRVFVVQHIFHQNTAGNVNDVYVGGRLGVEHRLSKLMAKYKNVIAFNGHSHFSLYLQSVDPAVNYYKGTGAQFLHMASTCVPRYADNSVKDTESEGYIIDVYEDYVMARGYDFKKDKYIAAAQYRIESDTESSKIKRVDIVGNTITGITYKTGQSVACLIAVFYNDNELMDVVFEPVTATANGVFTNNGTPLVIPPDTNCFKIMLWSGLENIKPITITRTFEVNDGSGKWEEI